jgi:ribosome recycling factor
MTTPAEVKQDADLRMQKAIESLKGNLAKVRTGRANTSLLEHIQVDYYGTPTALSQVANLSVLDARTLGVQPWEGGKMIALVEKAIRDADLGLNPSSQGNLIRVPMPALTEERRRDLVKIVRGEAEEAKVAIRNIRRDSNQQLKDALKEKLMSEDDERRGQDEVQKLTDRHIVEVDKLLQTKESDLMSV